MDHFVTHRKQPVVIVRRIVLAEHAPVTRSGTTTRRSRVGAGLLLGVLLASLLTMYAGAGSAGATVRQDDEPAASEQIAGTFRNRDDNNAPVSGVEIVVTDEAGDEVGSAVSDEDGSYSVDLPGPGTYTVILQTDSLPDGVSLTDSSKTTLSPTVNPGQKRAVVFPFGKETRKVVTTIDKVPGALLDGIQLGLIIAMTAIGLSLIYGTTQFTNFAHGEAVTSGALITWYLNQKAGLPVIGAVLIAVALSAVLGYVLDRGLWGPLRRKKTGPFSLMVVSFGLSIAAIAVFQFFYGTRTQPYSQYSRQASLFSIGNKLVPPRTVAIIVISVLVLGAVGLFLQRARFGKAMRAVADNGPLASASGINTERVVRLVWVMGTALAGLGGILYSLDQGVNFQQGQSILLLMFAGITLGGLGTSFGAAAGCFILGVAIQVSTLWIPTSLKNVGALVVLVIVLMFKPQGVFGRKERVG